MAEEIKAVQTRKVRSFPIVLYGTEYWSGMLGWLREEMLGQGYIHDKDLELLQLVDDPAEAVRLATRPGIEGSPEDGFQMS